MRTCFFDAKYILYAQKLSCVHTIVSQRIQIHNTCASASSVYCISALDLIECMHWIMHCKSQPFFQGPLLVEMCNIANPLKKYICTQVVWEWKMHHFKSMWHVALFEKAEFPLSCLLDGTIC